MSDVCDTMLCSLLSEEASKPDKANGGKSLAQKLGNTACKGNGTVTATQVDAGEEVLPLFNRKPPQYVRQQELPWHRLALERASMGYTAREIAEQLGCTPTAVQDILRQPQYQQVQVQMIKKELTKDQIVVDTIRNNVVAAVETLVDIMGDAKVKTADRIQAAKELLNRRYGMPNQPINRNTDVDLNKLSDKELADMLTVSGTNR